MRASIASMDAATAAGNCDALHALFIRALDCRQQRPASLHDVDVVEGAAVGECPRLTWSAGVGAIGVLGECWGSGGASTCQLLLFVACSALPPCPPLLLLKHAVIWVVLFCQLLLLLHPAQAAPSLLGVISLE